MSECRWSEGLSGSYCQTHFAYTEDMGVCHVADLIARAEKAEAAIKRVRELWTTCSCDRCTTNHLAILRALDGGDDE